MARKKPFGKNLTSQQRLFVAAFDGDPTKAAQKAGYSAKARDTGRQLMSKPHIVAAIQAKERGENALEDHTPAGVRLAKNALLLELLNTEEKLRDIHRTRLVADRRERHEFWSMIMRNPLVDVKSRLAASELLGRAHGDFLDRVQFEQAVVVFDGSPTFDVEPLTDAALDEVLEVDASPILSELETEEDHYDL